MNDLFSGISGAGAKDSSDESEEEKPQETTKPEETPAATPAPAQPENNVMDLLSFDSSPSPAPT